MGNDNVLGYTNSEAGVGALGEMTVANGVTFGVKGVNKSFSLPPPLIS